MNEKIDETLLRCPCLETESMGSDLSLLNDEIASYFGSFFSQFNEELPECLLKDLRTCQTYHMKLLSTVSTDEIITESDLEWMIGRYVHVRTSCEPMKGYLYPNGHPAATLMHVIRSKTRIMIRCAYLMEKNEHRIIPRLIEFANMASNYYFYVAVKINELKGIKPELFQSFSELLK